MEARPKKELILTRSALVASAYIVYNNWTMHLSSSYNSSVSKQYV